MLHQKEVIQNNFIQRIAMAGDNEAQPTYEQKKEEAKRTREFLKYHPEPERSAESTFEAAENAIVHCLKAEPHIRKFSQFNPWFTNLGNLDKGKLMSKYPEYGALMEPHNARGWKIIHESIYGVSNDSSIDSPRTDHPRSE